MKYRSRIKQYSNLFILFLGFVLLLNNVFVISIILIAFWYFAFGFISFSRMFLSIGMNCVSYFFLLLTCPLCLTPYFKSYYFATKSAVYLVMFLHKKDFKYRQNRFENTIKKIIKNLRKVHVEDFYTGDEKCIFYIQAAMSNLLINDIESADECIYLAECSVDSIDTYNQLLEKIIPLRDLIKQADQPEMNGDEVADMIFRT